ncbi:hypothetical protein OHV05_36735 (plasmid) [Kitasatospora sp. NBC_00070]|uniref:hypothetical protein n=1 Tax=Kitasatospora sp. NBC_00070 TaxID=2975962 RepID=UPI0032481382
MRHRTPRSRTLATALASGLGLASLLCATGTAQANSYTTPPPPTALGAPSPLSSSDCAWPILTDAATLNVAFPDSNSSYWVMPYNFTPGMKITVKGDYSPVRFFSLTAYQSDFSPVTGGSSMLQDAALAADNGAGNPFTNVNIKGGTYTATLTAGGAQGPNAIKALSSGETGNGYLIYRVYVPTPGVGTAKMPTITITTPSGSKDLKACKDPAKNKLMNAALTAVVRAKSPDPQPSAWAEPKFARQKDAATGGLFPNPANKYISAPFNYEAGKVVVVRGKAPTFPDTTHGASPATPSNLRYWSLCTNIYSKSILNEPYPVVQCAADYQTVLDGKGRYTYVVSTPKDKPANATTTNGVTWLDSGLGLTTRRGVLLMRNMLASPSFTHAVQNVPDGTPSVAVTRNVMGDYYPEAVSCDKQTFATGGADACFAKTS